MSRALPPSGIILAPVEHVVGIWRFRRDPGPPSHAFSTPGHLFHWMEEGSYHLTTNGRAYHVRAGDVIYYHGSEEVSCRWENHVVMYSVAFHAPALAPRPLEQRVFRANQRTGALFPRLYEAYLAPSDDPARLRLFGLLWELLRRVGMQPVENPPGAAEDGGAMVWEFVEGYLRRKRMFRADIETLSDIAHCSRATLNRLCRRATGMSPQERLRTVRMAEARGLLLYSPLSLGAIAEELGFGRQHEFTREFSHHFGHPPSRLRETRP